MYRIDIVSPVGREWLDAIVTDDIRDCYRYIADCFSDEDGTFVLVTHEHKAGELQTVVEVLDSEAYFLITKVLN